MSPALRRGALALVLVVLWVTLYVFPVREGHSAGWYVVFTLGIALTLPATQNIHSSIATLPRLDIA